MKICAAIWRDFIVIAIVTVLSVVALLFLLELGFRLTTPFIENKWPLRFDKEIGFLFQPLSELQVTNHLDYWTQSRTNSLGFLDREQGNNHNNDCRVVFIGDSFVEAVQVDLKDKLQVVLERLASNLHPEWHLATTAFGYSGTGQINQLAFYDAFVGNLAPRLVVLVFVKNDFANNSALLEAIRYGWDPRATPRHFVKKIGDKYSISGISADWERSAGAYFGEGNVNLDWIQKRHKWLVETSYFYNWLYTKLLFMSPGGIEWLSGSTRSDLIAKRIVKLKSDPEYAPVLADWENRFNFDIDAPAGYTYLPLAYQQALEFTRFGLEQFKRRSIRDGFQLALLVANNIHQPSRIAEGLNDADGIRIMQRVKSLGKELDIPIIDQRAFIEARGGNQSDTAFRHDQHWSKYGHRTAAASVLQYLESKPFICGDLK